MYFDIPYCFSATPLRIPRSVPFVISLRALWREEFLLHAKNYTVKVSEMKFLVLASRGKNAVEAAVQRHRAVFPMENKQFLLTPFPSYLRVGIDFASNSAEC